MVTGTEAEPEAVTCAEVEAGGGVVLYPGTTGAVVGITTGVSAGRAVVTGACEGTTFGEVTVGRLVTTGTRVVVAAGRVAEGAEESNILLAKKRLNCFWFCL